MPKAYDEKSHDQELYEARIGELDLERHQRFAEAKAVGDFLILATTQVGVGALFWVLWDRAQHSEIAVKPALGLLAMGLLGLYFFLRVNRIVELFVLSALLRIEQYCRAHVLFLRGYRDFNWSVSLKNPRPKSRILQTRNRKLTTDKLLIDSDEPPQVRCAYAHHPNSQL